jgi:hypothetical protein
MSGTSPDRAVVAEYGCAALQNARDLIADAQVLLDQQPWPRACSLAILATEEVAKASTRCILPMLSDEAAEHFAWPLDQVNRTHGLKLEIAGMLTHVLDFYMGGPDAPTRYPSDLAELNAGRRQTTSASNADCTWDSAPARSCSRPRSPNGKQPIFSHLRRGGTLRGLPSGHLGQARSLPERRAG